MKLSQLHRQEYQNKEEGKDHESIQSRTIPDPGHRMEKRHKTQENITYKKAKRPPCENLKTSSRKVLSLFKNKIQELDMNCS